MEKENLDGEINEIKQWHQTYGIHLADHYAKIDGWLLNKTEKDREKLTHLFQDKEFLSNYYRDTALSQMNIIIDIYHLEKENNTAYTILDQANSMQGLIDHYSEIKFYIWRIEFECDEKAIRSFIQFVTDKNPSIPSIIYTLHICAFHKTNAAYNIAHILRKYHHASIQAYELLKYAFEQSPDDEQILCELADICFELKQFDLMNHWLSNIKNPSSIFLEYKKRWGL